MSQSKIIKRTDLGMANSKLEEMLDNSEFVIVKKVDLLDLGDRISNAICGECGKFAINTPELNKECEQDNPNFFKNLMKK